MRTLMLFLFVVVVIAGAVAAAIWFLPWWLSLTLFVLVLAPAAWILLKIPCFIKSLTSTLGGIIPQEKLCSLPAGDVNAVSTLRR